MRASDWIQAGFAVLIALVGWFAPLPQRRRWNITCFALFAIILIALAYALERFVAPVSGSILRDWLPVLITLVPYWQTGQFFQQPDENIQSWLVGSDKWFFALLSRTGWNFGGRTRLTMEWAYMMCYPIVPLGLGVLYVAGLRRYADVFWFLVLVPTYICYAITPFFPALPPRSLGVDANAPRKNKSRTFNLWILKLGSIQAISFPSAHVASALGTALAILHYVPSAGVVFVVIAFWISVAAVAGRYHYAIDALLGAILPLAIYFLWCTGWIPSTLLTAPAISFVARL